MPRPCFSKTSKIVPENGLASTKIGFGPTSLEANDERNLPSADDNDDLGLLAVTTRRVREDPSPS